MTLSIIILFILTLAGGLAVFIVPKFNSKYFQLSLVFAGSYLFSITIIHILPELFSTKVAVNHLAFYVLLGFFIQVIIEYFTEGVEHGHLHHEGGNHHHQDHKWIGLLIALCIHAFLEGTLLAHPQGLHNHADNNSLFYGILMHKIPAAFALMSVLVCQFKSKLKTFLLLFIFSLASPVGIISSTLLHENQYFSEEFFAILFAIVSGNFLHISTTIFFESSPNHNFSGRKLFVAAGAAIIAMLAEFWT
ncbi:MAG: zinc and cadmium transporter [Marivirga sp.]|jgi:zinc and cadmium transporter